MTGGPIERPDDVCQCGDFRRQHDAAGCHVCRCRRFRFFRQSEAVEIRQPKLKVEMPKVEPAPELPRATCAVCLVDRPGYHFPVTYATGSPYQFDPPICSFCMKAAKRSFIGNPPYLGMSLADGITFTRYAAVLAHLAKEISRVRARDTAAGAAD